MLGVARCRVCSFNAKKVSRQVSRFAQKCRDCGQSVTDRLESFYNRDTHATLFFNARHPRDTQGIAMFCLIKRLIPVLLGDRSSVFTIRDTSPDFLAQINKINIFYPSRYRDRILPYFKHNWGNINLLCKSFHF